MVLKRMKAITQQDRIFSHVVGIAVAIIFILLVISSGVQL